MAIVRDNPKLMLRWRYPRNPHEQKVLEQAIFEQDTETGKRWHVWEPVPFVQESCHGGLMPTNSED